LSSHGTGVGAKTEKQREKFVGGDGVSSSSCMLPSWLHLTLIISQSSHPQVPITLGSRTSTQGFWGENIQCITLTVDKFVDSSSLSHFIRPQEMLSKATLWGHHSPLHAKSYKTDNSTCWSGEGMTEFPFATGTRVSCVTT
jgi:hypothetical protein